MTKNKVISWDQYFMAVAKISALRSKDPSTQVGACIVNTQNKIIGIGYNGLPIGCDDNEFPWTNDTPGLDSKYPYVVHAEANAILNSTTKLDGARIYVSLFPCNECAKLIIQSRISEVVFESDKYSNTDAVKASKRMFDAAKVKYRQVPVIEVSVNE